MPYIDSVPVSKDTKQRIRDLQLKVAKVKQVPKVSQVDLMDIMTKEYEKSIDFQLTKS